MVLLLWSGEQGLAIAEVFASSARTGIIFGADELASAPVVLTALSKYDPSTIQIRNGRDTAEPSAP